MGQPSITALLRELAGAPGDRAGTSGRLHEIVYAELRRLAARLMRRERRDHTLDPTGLVHEAYLRLAGSDAGYEDRAQFLGIAARVMRQVLVDHARRRGAVRRGGGALLVTLDPDRLHAPGTDLLALDETLDDLASLDPRGARVVELRVFAGMTVAEIARLLGVSKRTVDDDWAMAKMWLARRLRSPTGV